MRQERSHSLWLSDEVNRDAGRQNTESDTETDEYKENDKHHQQKEKDVDESVQARPQKTREKIDWKPEKGEGEWQRRTATHPSQSV